MANELPPIGIEDYQSYQSDQFGQTTDAMLATLDKPPAPTTPPIVADQADRATPPTPPEPALPDAASISSPIDASASPPAAPAAPAMAPAQPAPPPAPVTPPSPDDLSPALNAASAAGVDPGVFIAAHQSGHVDPNNWFDSATQLAGHIKDAGGDLVQGLAAFTGSATNAAKVLDRAVANLNPAPVATTPDNSAQGATQTTAELSGGGKAVPLGDAAHTIMSAAANSAAWLGEQGQKALQAILVTEGGMTGARGDQGNSAGPLQFYSGGQLANFAQEHGLTQDAAKQYVEAHPAEAVAWAIGSPDHPGYLGSALAAGLQKGLSGPALATYGQQHGQVSVSPERAGQNWNALFGNGSGPFTTTAATSSGTANSVSQFGDPQLTTDEAYAACGPAAAVRFAQAEGRNPTLREATDLAKSVGWTSAAGMAGLQSEKALMDKLQIPTRVVSGAAWDAFSREAQTGNPVTISTAGHYFYADGFNPDTGAFHVGQSGLDLKGGSEWMTPAQMTARMGPVQGGLLADNPNISNPSTVMGANQPADRQDRADASASNQTAQVPSSTGNSALDWLGQQKDALASSIGNAASGVGTAVSGAVDAAGNALPTFNPTLDPNSPVAQQAAGNPQNPLAVKDQAVGGLADALVPAGTPVLSGAAHIGLDPANLAFGPVGYLANAGGAAASDVTKQLGGDQTAQTVAGLAGGLAAGVTPAVAERAAGPLLSRALGAADRISPPAVAFASTAAGPVDRATAESTPAALRFFHGTGSDFAVPDGAKFDPNGLFGPGYYMTDSPEVAGGLGVEGIRTGYANTALRTLDHAQLEDAFAETANTLAAQGSTGKYIGGTLVNDLAKRRQNMFGPDQIDAMIDNADRDSRFTPALNELRVKLGISAGPNVRAIDVPQDLNLFNVDAPVTPELRQNVVDALAASQDLMDQARALRIEYWEKRNGAPLTGEGVWKTLSEESPARATQILSDAGYDGIQYQGGRRTPMVDTSGNPIQHTAINVFPSSLDKLRNAISGTQGGSASAQFASTLGGAAAGGATAYQTTDPNDPNRGLKIAGGALAGGLVGYGASRAVPTATTPAVSSSTVPGAAATGSPELAALRKMYEPDITPNPQSIGDRLDAAASNLTRAFTDRQVDINKAQQAYTKALGRPLNANEMASELQRLAADPAAEVKIDQGLKPAIQSVGDDYAALRDYVTLRSNVEVAEGAGTKVQETGMAKAVPSSLRDDLNAANTSVRMRQDILNQLQNDSVPDTARINTTQRSLNASQKAVQRAQDAIDTWTQANTQGSVTAGADAAQNRMFSGGLNREQSLAGMQALEQELGPERFAKVKDAADQVTAFNQDLRQRLVDSGVLSDQQATDMERLYPNWAKTRILDYMADPAGGQSSGTKIGLSSNEVKAYSVEGTSKAREDPLASTVAYAHQVERMAMKNEAFTAFTAIDQASPAPMLRKVAQDFSPTSKQVTMVGFEDGQKVKYVTDNKALGEAINGAGVMSAPGWTSAWSQIFRSLATSRNPVFLAGNAALDIPTYVLRTAIREGGPQHLPAVLGELAKGYVGAFQGILQGEYTGATADFLKAGGGQSGYFTGAEGAAKQTVADLQRSNAFQINSKADIGRLMKDLITLKPVEALGERVELGPRVAAYNMALNRGDNLTKAVIDGRTVTVDFSQGGTVTKYLNNFIPFFNVGFQGPVQIARAFKDNPLAFAATTGTLIGMPTIAAEAWNRMDPQRARDYADVPDQVKNQGIVVMLPGEAPVDQGGNRKPLYAVLKLREWAPFASLARDGAAQVLGDHSRSWQDIVSGAATGLSPTQSTSLGQAGTEPISGIPVLPAAGQLALNKDFFRGKDIVTARADQNASATAKAMVPVIQAFVDKAGINAEVRPSAVDFFIRNQGAGVGGAAIGAGDMAAGTPPRDNSPQSLPVVGGLIGRFSGTQTGAQLQQANDDSSLTPDMRTWLRSSGVAYTPTPVGSTFAQIPLRQGEETRWQQLTNQYVESALQKLRASSDWNTLPTPVRNSRVQAVTTAARDRAGGEVLNMIPASERQARQRAKSSAP